MVDDKTNELLCNHCGEVIDKSGGNYFVIDNYHYCDDECAREDGWEQCDDCDVWEKDCIYMENLDVFVCIGCSEDYFKCDSCRDWGHVDDRYVSPGDDYYCCHCFDYTCFICDNCGETYWRDDYGGNGLCYSCYEDNSDCYDDYARSGTKSLTHLYKTHNLVGNPRTFGLELETSKVDSDDDGIWTCCYDGSISGMEYVSPVLKGDEGLDDIKRFLGKINARVDNDCGYHLHIGCPDYEYRDLVKLLKAYYKLEDYFYNLVSDDRWNNNFCRKLKDRQLMRDLVAKKIKGKDHFETKLYGRKDRIESLKRDKCGSDRYYWVNIQSYYYRGTVEIRLHQGTLNYDKITHWIKLHTNFIEWVKNTSQTAMLERINSIRNNKDFLIFINKLCGIDTAMFYAERLKDLHGIEVDIKDLQALVDTAERLNHNDEVARYHVMPDMTLALEGI